MNLAQRLEHLRTLLSRYTTQQKLAMLASGVGVVVLLWLLVYFVNQVDYQVLYRDLEPQEAQTIVDKLRDLRVPHQISDDSRSITVPADRIPELRLQLSTAGLPESGKPGWEIFDRTNFGTTSFQDAINQQRALEGELVRTILTLQEVDSARVHLVLPKDSLFQTPEDQTKASVTVRLKNGKTLSTASVQGIVRLVAGSVKGLTPDKVTVVDVRGRVLSQSEQDTLPNQQEIDSRKQIEDELTRKIVQILEPVVGTGKVRPQVFATLNWQQVEETIEQYDPNASVVRSAQKQEERGNSPVAAGVPGPRPVVAQPQAAPAAPDPGAALPVTKQSETTNYEVSKAVRHVRNPQGRIERLSVAVLVDNVTRTTTGTDGKTQTASEPRKPEELQKLKELVSGAVGYNEQRGDQLVIQNISFENEVMEVPPATFLDKQAPLILTALRLLIVPILFVLVYILFLRPAQKAIFTPLPQLEATAVAALPAAAAGDRQRPMTVRELEAQLNGLGALPPGMHVPDRAPVAGALPAAAPKIELIRSQILDHAKRDPETVAKLVRTWLNEERKKEE